MNRVLILRGGALGDFLLTLPLFHALRFTWPEVRLEVVGPAAAGRLAEIGGVIDAIHPQSEARWSALFTGDPLPAALRDWLGGFDAVLNFWPDPEGELARHFPLHGAQRFVSRPAGRVTTAPASAHFLAALPELGLEIGGAFTARLTLPASQHFAAQERLTLPPAYWAIHPGSGGSNKNWSRENWRALVERLAPHPVLIVLGEVEAETGGTRFFESLQSPRVQLADRWPLAVLGAALAAARGFIGHDSGISHLAAAVGARCILLFGPTDPAIWAPTGAQVIRRGETLAAISVDDVDAAADGST